jgi:hypothetical protein
VSKSRQLSCTATGGGGHIVLLHLDFFEEFKSIAPAVVSSSFLNASSEAFREFMRV